MLRTYRGARNDLSETIKNHEPEDRPRQDDRSHSDNINIIKRHSDTVAQTFANFCSLLDGRQASLSSADRFARSRRSLDLGKGVELT